MKGAEIIVDHLVQRGMPYLFGVCGHGILGFLDAAYDRRDEIATITTHDERVAGLMADAYYRVRGEPVATYTSCGPGSANIVMSVASAFQDSSAFLAITGNVPTQQFNRGPFQETGRFFQGDFTSVMRPYVKRSYQPTRADMVPLAVRQAYELMISGRPGPVHLDVPLNVFVEETDQPVADVSDWRNAQPSRPAGDPASVEAAARLLAGASRPLIVAGNGAFLSGAGEAIYDLATRYAIPVITSPLGKGLIDENDRLSLGPTGRNGTFAANKAARTSDVILALGTRFDDRATSAWIPGVTYSIPESKLIHVDIDPQEIARNYPPEIAVLADARTFVQQLDAALAGLDGVEPKTAWSGETAAWKECWDADIAERQEAGGMPAAPDRVVAELNGVLPEDAIVLADVGVHHNWLVQQLKVPRNGAFLQAWGYAAMGFGIAGSLGAQFAAPNQPVVTVCGDGGFLMHANAVATAVEYDLPVTWLVWNNKGYGSIYGQQKGFFGENREIATRFRRQGEEELFSPDFVAMARSMGADASRAERPGDIGDHVRTAMESGRPTVVEVEVDEYSHAAPATGSWDLPPLPGPDPSYGWEGSELAAGRLESNADQPVVR